MTGYTVHTGASKKFVAGWDNIFGDKAPESGGKKKSSKAKKKSGAPAAKKKSKKKKTK